MKIFYIKIFINGMYIDIFNKIYIYKTFINYFKNFKLNQYM